MIHVRRVPTGFTHPVGTPWNPDPGADRGPCPDCRGTGYIPGRAALRTTAKRLAEDPDPEVVAVAVQIAVSEVTLPGASLDQPWVLTWYLTRALVRAAGHNPDTWGDCTTCDGRGTLPTTTSNTRDALPPTGDAWQLWNINPTGAFVPITPPYPTDIDLARHIANRTGPWGPPHGDLNHAVTFVHRLTEPETT